MLIKTTFDCGVQSTEITSLENQPSIAGTTENPIPSFFCSESERILFLLVKTTDEKTFVRFQIDDCEEHVYYQYICRDNVPLFVYFTTQSMDSQRYDEGFLEIYTIFIVYQDEIVKLCLKKEFATHLEFESCDFHRMSLFNGMSHLELKNRVFARHPVIPHGMKGLEVRVECDGVEVIQVIEFTFDLDPSRCSSANVLNTFFDVMIKMPPGFSSGEISEECIGSFLVSGTTDGGAEKGWICVCCIPDCDHYYPTTDSSCIVIFQTRYGNCDRPFTVLIDDNDDRLKSQVENASCLHQKVGALIVSFKKPQIFQELLKEYPFYLSQK